MFHAELFEAADWVTAIKGSGAQYVLPVAKHHDGFCMWDARDTAPMWNAAQVGPQRDVLTELCGPPPRSLAILSHPSFFFVAAGTTLPSRAACLSGSIIRRANGSIRTSLRTGRRISRRRASSRPRSSLRGWTSSSASARPCSGTPTADVSQRSVDILAGIWAASFQECRQCGQGWLRTSTGTTWTG